MKFLKKLFLVATLLSLSGINFLGAMEKDPDEKTPLIQADSPYLLRVNKNKSDKKFLLDLIFTKIAQTSNRNKPTLLKNWEKFRKINLHDLDMSQTIETILSALKPLWKEIKELDLSFCKLTDLPKFFTKDNFTQLETLNLQGNTPNNDLLKKIAKFQLKKLNLSYCGISNLSNIFKGNKLLKLENLNLQGNFKLFLDKEEKTKIKNTFKTTTIIFN